jgi:hypothetical protein
MNRYKKISCYFLLLMCTLMSACTSRETIPSGTGGPGPGEVGEPTVRASELGLSAVITLPEQVQVGEDINLKFTLTNSSETPIYVLKWYTPLEGIYGEIFRVYYKGRAIQYLGIQASRGAPIADDYVYLEPGGSATAVVDLATSYDFSKAGTYRIAFASPRISHVVYSEDQFAKSLDDLGPVEMPSKSVTLELLDK